MLADRCYSVGMKQEILLIGGGDFFSNRDNFLEYLRTVELRDIPKEAPYKSWKQWLVEELGDDYWVDIPNMPNKENAKYDEWKIWFERHLGLIDGPVVLIGLSLGAQFLAKYLIENDLSVEIRALFLLAGPCGYFDDPQGMDCASFQFPSFDLPAIKDKVDNIYILHSKDDFVVPYEHALQYKAALPEAELVTFTNKNHFLVEELPELVEMIRKIAKTD